MPLHNNSSYCDVRENPSRLESSVPTTSLRSQYSPSYKQDEVWKRLEQITEQVLADRNQAEGYISGHIYQAVTGPRNPFVLEIQAAPKSMEGPLGKDDFVCVVKMFLNKKNAEILFAAESRDYQPLAAVVRTAFATSLIDQPLNQNSLEDTRGTQGQHKGPVVIIGFKFFGAALIGLLRRPPEDTTIDENIDSQSCAAYSGRSGKSRGLTILPGQDRD